VLDPDLIHPEKVPVEPRNIQRSPAVADLDPGPIRLLMPESQLG